MLLPGVTTLARLVARIRKEANQRLWDTLYGLPTVQQRQLLEDLLEVPRGRSGLGSGAVAQGTDQAVWPQPGEGAAAWRTSPGRA